jgi:hypothetical protein
MHVEIAICYPEELNACTSSVNFKHVENSHEKILQKFTFEDILFIEDNNHNIATMNKRKADCQNVDRLFMFKENRSGHFDAFEGSFYHLFG